jgi:hypothetical protein
MLIDVRLARYLPTISNKNANINNDMMPATAIFFRFIFTAAKIPLKIVCIYFPLRPATSQICPVKNKKPTL